MDALKQLSAGIIMAGAALLLSSCGTVTSTFKQEDTGVVYALGSREGFSSPLVKSLETACPVLRFADNDFHLTGAHQKVLQQLAAAWKAKKPRYLIVGYAAAGLPEDHARSLSDRRAQAVRQFLIENGIEAANLQVLGFGNDVAPAGGAADAVVVYQQ